ncbi:MAG: hypothetical protein HQL54_03850 [Magnetococcales bacterium]|nr:hypothetical protein [Magnetococcales bacterium]
MSSRFAQFDPNRLTLHPLSARQHDLDLSVIKSLRPMPHTLDGLDQVADRLVRAKRKGASIVLMMGAHVLRAGVQRYLIDWMEKGLLSAIALNGAGVIHDYEFARIGATTESVAHYIRDGRFGMWQETGEINDIVREAHQRQEGIGEAVGRVIAEGDFKHADISMLAHAWRLGVPVTVHVGIGYDIIHPHANFDGAAWGATSHRDFLRFAHVLENLENGVVMNLGSAVMGPEVYLKALSMVRNVAQAENRQIAHFTTLVCDLRDLPSNVTQGEAVKQNPSYYYRPWKTMLVRTVADGGESFYVRGDHAHTVPQLWSLVNTRYQSDNTEESRP